MKPKRPAQRADPSPSSSSGLGLIGGVDPEEVDADGSDSYDYVVHGVMYERLRHGTESFFATIETFLYTLCKRPREYPLPDGGAAPRANMEAA